MKYILLTLGLGGFLFSVGVRAQSTITRQRYGEIRMDANQQLVIQPSATSAATDFDFLVGNWVVRNRRLKSVLSGSTEWEEFETRIETQRILLGNGCREKYSGKVHGKDYEAIAVRLFNPQTRLWTDHWADNGGDGFEEHPPVGSFAGAIGRFFARDHLKGFDVIVLYQWDATDRDHPVWSQAFSKDGGESWEWNWVMTLSRA